MNYLRDAWEEHYSKKKPLDENPNFCLFKQVYEQYFAGLSGSILDLGFGDGRILEFLQQRGHKSLYGVDLSQNAVDLVKRRLGNNLNLIRGDISKIGRMFPMNNFEAIILSMSLHHRTYESARMTLMGCNQVLNHGGLIYILTRSDKAILNQRKVGESSYFIPGIKRSRVHFSRDLLRQIIPSSWENRVFEEVDYMGTNNRIGAFKLVLSKS